MNILLNDEVWKRLRSVVAHYTAIICVGLFYGYVLIPIGISVPCVFRKITGLKCPGCGVTQMCLDILHGNILASWNENRGLFAILPWLIFLQGKYDYLYLKYGDVSYTKKENTAYCILACFTVAWGVFRNIVGL
jgi:hypothetical protein